jgi:hypothetical protein
MKSFKDFQEQLERGRLTPSTPTQTQQQRATSARRANVIARRMRHRAEDELSSHQANMRTLLKKSGEDIKGSH